MRRTLLLALMAVSLIPSASAFAQGRRPQTGEDDPQEQARKRQRDQDFEDFKAPLPGLANAGPCPYVKVLYDAARYVEFTDKREASSSVGYSGEIEGISAACAYSGTNPISIDMIQNSVLAPCWIAPVPCLLARSSTQQAPSCVQSRACVRDTVISSDRSRSGAR